MTLDQQSRCEERSARWASFGVVVLWSGSGVFAHLATGRWSALQAAWWESLCGLLVVTALSLRRNALRGLPSLGWGDLLRLTVLGVLAHTGYYTFLFVGFATGHQVETMALNYTWAVFMVLFGAIINHARPTWPRLLAVLFGALGAIAVLVPDPANVEPFSWGTVAGLGAGICFGLFTPLSVRWGYDPRTVTSWMMLVSFICFSVALAVEGISISLAWQGLVGAAYLGVGVDGIGYVLWQRANRVLPPWVLAVWACLIPVMNLALLSAAFALPISRTVFLGFSFIIIGIAIQQACAVLPHGPAAKERC